MNTTQLLEITTVNAQYTIGDHLRSKHIISHPSSSRNIFYTSTCSLKRQNEIQIIEYIEEDNKIQPLKQYFYKGLFQKIIPSKLNEDHFYLLYSEYENCKEQTRIALCTTDATKINQDNLKQKEQLQVMLEIENGRHIHSIMPLNEEKLIVADNECLNLYDVNSNKFIQSFASQNQISLSELDPHHPNLIASVHNNNNNISIFDIRENKIKFESQGAHQLSIFDIDFNLNKQYYLMSSSEDGSVKFWDIRKFQLPMKILDKFVNMPMNSKYNKFHDQLIITSFNDASLQLYRVNSVSSAPIDKNVNQIIGIKEEDGPVKLYDDHEDTIYSIAWSSNSAWIFASVSYNANVIINLVPSSEKYRILL